ncbi:EF-hand domain-containing protein [Ottowia testudinis]|uniref:EF-hand domain-containing protein n=1 Tax=Ottowia testudinis TaxID=2816950 RepID=A0A975CGA0_9BURK|nr:EF-hand domain-containing protein [Ottowia testudinis]QTD45860.1 hypothetical protein J1M35_02775 [Ottowia testudinis]
MTSFRLRQLGLFAALAAAWAASGAVLAQTGPAPFSTYDRDGNGLISEAEFNAVRAERRAAGQPMRNARGFADLDANRDGQLSPEEFAARPMGRGRGMGQGMGGGGMGGGRGMAMPSFASYDLNGDGRITEAEYEKARVDRISGRLRQGYAMRNLKDVRFADIDTNRDGVVDAAEFAAHQAQHMRGTGRAR